MKILQIIARSLSACFGCQDFCSGATLAASVNFGEILEEKPRAVKQRSPRPIMVDRQRVNPGFDIGEVLQKKLSHICVDFIAIRDRQIGARATPRFLTLLPTRGLGETAHGKTVPNIPSDARQLASTISYARYKAGKWSIHASRPNSIT
jgi:hypothetical protein